MKISKECYEALLLKKKRLQNGEMPCRSECSQCPIPHELPNTVFKYSTSTKCFIGGVSSSLIGSWKVELERKRRINEVLEKIIFGEEK